MPLEIGFTCLSQRIQRMVSKNNWFCFCEPARFARQIDSGLYQFISKELYYRLASEASRLTFWGKFDFSKMTKNCSGANVRQNYPKTARCPNDPILTLETPLDFLFRFLAILTLGSWSGGGVLVVTTTCNWYIRIVPV